MTTGIRHGWLALAILSLGVATVAVSHGAEAERPAGPVEAEPLFPPPPLPRRSQAADAERANDARHQLWLVDTRTLPHGSQAACLETPPVRRLDERGEWSDATLDALLAAANPQMTTSVLVHGNDTDSGLAVSKGLEVYRSLVQEAQPEQRVRLIVWSWPSDHIPGPFRADARIKAQRTNSEAFYLARFLDKQRGDAPISLLGYSFGARVITGALHLVGGGTLEGRRLGSRELSSRPPLHAVLMAAAVDRDWLLPGRNHGRALNVVDRMVLLINPQDRVLRWYRFLSPGEGRAALGSTGLTAAAELGVHREKLVQINVADAVGNRHGWPNYIGSPEIVRRLHQETLVETQRRTAQRLQAGGG